MVGFSSRELDGSSADFDLEPTVTREWDDSDPEPLPAEPSATASSRSAKLDGAVVPGDRLKHYEIIAEIGEGGMGRVFVARDLKLGRRVALKVVRTDSPSATARFLV